jgi:hypothetical protein
MTMTVQQFIRWLETQDQDATVEIMVGVRGTGYKSDSYRVDDFDPEKHADYTDMRGNPFAVGKSWENARTLCLGGEE